jgi:uncharacterized protein (DUF169 family)
MTKTNLGILDKFGFDVQPVGVKFLAKRPDMVQNENLALCKMPKKAHEGNAFFAKKKTILVKQDYTY